MILCHKDHPLTVMPGVSGDRGCVRCKKLMVDDAPVITHIADARGRYWCIECVVLTLGQHTRIEEDRPDARYTWDFPIVFAHGCSADHDPGLACKHGACCVDCKPKACAKSTYEWFKNRSDPQ
jgi:hypothetical protein